MFKIDRMADNEKKDEVESTKTPAVVEYGCVHYARKCSFVVCICVCVPVNSTA